MHPGGCIDCAPGRFADLPAGSDIAHCMLCPSGRFVDAAGSDHSQDCEACRPGRFQPQRGSTNCTNCDIGQYMPETGALACLFCCDGTEPNGSHTVCLTCEPGWVSDGTTCAPCLGGAKHHAAHLFESAASGGHILVSLNRSVPCISGM
jgi:hypothetical protein